MLKKSILIIMTLGSLSLIAAQKSRMPYIGYAYPAGAAQGSELQIIVGGMNFRGLKKAEISGNGVEVNSIRTFRPFKRFSNDLRRELMPIMKAIDEGKDPIAESKKNSKKIIARLKRQKARAEKDAEEAKKNGISASTTTAKKNVNYEKELKIVPGERLIYIDMTPEEVVKKIKSLSPIEYECLMKGVFSRRNNLQTAPAIAQIAIINIKVAPDATPGFRELRFIGKEGISNQIPFVIGTLPEKSNVLYRRDKKNPPQKLQLATITNGQIMPGEVDKYFFEAKNGQTYSFELLGRTLVPYLSDAVPGWFQPIISIHTTDGKTLAFADDNQFHPDPILSFKAPADGKYELHIRDSIYRGREDFVYRLKASLGEQKQTKTKYPVFKNKLPKKTESEPNNTVESSEKVKFPVLVSGKINKPGDLDVYCFDGKKGEKIVAEIFARRFDSPMDSLLKLTDSKGKTLAWNDDYKWLNIGTKTHHSDSYLLYELPDDGKYFIKVADIQAKGGDLFDYTLRIDKPRPDFKVFMTPSAINTRSRISVPITMEVFREDGFKGPIDIFVKKGPKGLKLSGEHIPAGVNKIKMTITAPKIEPGLYDIILAAKAKNNSKEIINDVIPTDEIMQAFLYTHLVPTEKSILNITRKGWLPVKPLIPKNISITPGEKYDFKLYDYQHKTREKRKKEKKEVVFKLLSPPKGVSLTKTGYKDKHYLLRLSTTPETKPWQGNLIINCIAKGIRKKEGKPDRAYSYPIGFLPALPLNIKKIN